MNAISHRFARVDGLRFHYLEGGEESGRPIVLLAGFPESAYAWRHVIPSLAEHHRILAIDLPGQGESDRPLDGYDTQTTAERLHGLLVHLKINRYCIAAHDVGASVAFPYGLLFGDEIESLVLMDAGIPGVSLPELLPSAPEKGWKTWHFPFQGIPDLPETLLEGKERAYLEWFFRNKTANPHSYTDDDIDEYVRVLKSPGGLRAALGFYRASSRSAAQNRALTESRKLTMPLLALSADQGSIPDMAATLRPFATNVRGEVIRDCGHFQPEERPAAVAAALMEFFA